MPHSLTHAPVPSSGTVRGSAPRNPETKGATSQHRINPWSSTLKEKYQQEIVPAMKKEFGYRNSLAVPRLNKAVVHMGTGAGLKDAKFLEGAEATLRRITGQAPVKTLAKKSIANFKIRQGMVVGLKVTLRGKRMWDFLTKLTNVALPRVRDFRGLDPKAVDRQGNASFGFKEHVVFPEIRSDEVERLHGLEVVVDTTATSYNEGLSLLRHLGFPFRK